MEQSLFEQYHSIGDCVHSAILHGSGRLARHLPAVQSIGSQHQEAQGAACCIHEVHGRGGMRRWPRRCSGARGRPPCKESPQHARLQPASASFQTNDFIRNFEE